jgi:hypothetical protein
MHTALWCLTAISIVGAFVALARPKQAKQPVVVEAEPQPQLT